MQRAVAARTPAHVWIVGILSLLWSCIGCSDYLISRLRLTDLLKKMDPPTDPQAMLSYIDGFPLWASLGWGLGVWLGLAGSVLLLMRSRHAVWAFGISLLGAILGLGYQLANPMPGAEGFGAKGFPLVIIAIALALFLYARRQAAKGVLR
jgi:hypothetical protein